MDGGPLRETQDTRVEVTTSLKLAPSDFGFLWDECRRCFYLKVAKGIGRPRTVMPSIFTAIDGQMKTWSTGKSTQELCDELPPGRVAYAGNWVESRPGTPREGGPSVYVRGPFDTVLRFDDGTYAVADFKTSKQKPENVLKYGRQLHAYAHALENPAPRKLGLSPVKRLGLLVYEPTAFDSSPSGQARLDGSLKWMEIPLEMHAFHDFLGEVVDVLSAAEVPPAADGCSWCEFRTATRQHAF